MSVVTLGGPKCKSRSYDFALVAQRLMSPWTTWFYVQGLPHYSIHCYICWFILQVIWINISAGIHIYYQIPLNHHSAFPGPSRLRLPKPKPKQPSLKLQLAKHIQSQNKLPKRGLSKDFGLEYLVVAFPMGMKITVCDVQCCFVCGVGIAHTRNPISFRSQRLKLTYALGGNHSGFGVPFSTS